MKKITNVYHESFDGVEFTDAEACERRERQLALYAATVPGFRPLPKDESIGGRFLFFTGQVFDDERRGIDYFVAGVHYVGTGGEVKLLDGTSFWPKRTELFLCAEADFLNGVEVDESPVAPNALRLARTTASKTVVNKLKRRVVGLIK